MNDRGNYDLRRLLGGKIKRNTLGYFSLEVLLGSFHFSSSITTGGNRTTWKKPVEFGRVRLHWKEFAIRWGLRWAQSSELRWRSRQSFGGAVVRASVAQSSELRWRSRQSFGGRSRQSFGGAVVRASVAQSSELRWRSRQSFGGAVVRASVAQSSELRWRSRQSKRLSPLSLEFDPWVWGFHSSHSCEKSKSTLCRKSWVFSGHSGFLPQGKLTGWV